MNFESYIAQRYLKSKHKLNFITIISFLSIAGVTIGVAALIVVLSVFNGFGSLVTSYLRNFDPDLRVEIISDVKIVNELNLKTKLLEHKEIKAVSPFVTGKVLAYRDHLTQVINLKGISQNEEKELYNISSSILYGNASLRNTKNIPSV